MKGVYITASLFDILRWTNLGFYRDVEMEYQAIGINIHIEEVSVVPLEIEGDQVRYLVTATDYQFLDDASRDKVYAEIEGLV